MRHQLVLVLDYGSQFTQLIARRVRELNVYCEIVPFDCSAAAIVERAPDAIILSGGPASVTADDAPDLSPVVLDLGVPILGICYGLQVLTRTLGGEVAPSARREYGKAWLLVDDGLDLFDGLDDPRTQVWMSHGDHVVRPAPGFSVLALGAFAAFGAFTGGGSYVLAALTLLNDPTFVEAARAFAARILRTGGSTDDDRLTSAFRLAVSRPPDSFESRILMKLLAENRVLFSASMESAQQVVSTGQAPVDRKHPPAELAAWTVVARAILNLNETNTRN